MSTTSKKKQGAGWAGRFVNAVQTTVASHQEAAKIKQEAKEVGKVWNAETKTWEFYFLDQELEQVEALLKKESDEKKTTEEEPAEREVADREYYDLLGVSTNADDLTIRKAYFKAARKCHPDKNPDDPDAHSKFQQLGHAYQILSNPDKRAAYDRDGKQEGAANGMEGEVDPFTFFNVMFGSTLIEPYVGELWIATTSDSVMKDQTSMADLDSLPPDERDAQIQERIESMQQKNSLKQRQRQIKCAQNLRDRIASYDPAKKEEFVQSARNEAIKIVNGAYGALYLNTIGFALEMAAEEYLGFEKSFLGLSGHLARTRKNASAVGSNFKLLSAGIRAASAGSRAMQEAEKFQQQQQEKGEEEIDEKAAQELMTETLDGSLPSFLEFAWAINKRDIQSTLHAVCKKLFDDASVPKESRFVRAKAVRTLGREFRAVGKAFRKQAEDNFHAEDIKARVAVATMTTMAKAQGQEVTEEDQQEMIQQAKKMSVETKSTEASGSDGETETPSGESKKV